ncbi:MAG: DUF3440 domain-containing protein [Armatimonadia bacterium]|nr:DUF3440 domain-containing protein [Armatimonadia bacterium]
MAVKPNRFQRGLPSHTRTKKQVDEDVWTLAQRRMDVVYERYDQVSVMFSGGKDSTACLHVALDAAHRHGRLPLDVVFFDEEAISPMTVDYVKRVADRDDVTLRWLCVPQALQNACSPKHPFWWPWDPDERERWCRPLPHEQFPDLPLLEPPILPGQQGVVWPTLGHGHDRHQHRECNIWLFPDRTKLAVSILGLRSYESLQRHRGVSNRVADNYLSRDPASAPWVTLAKPVYDWTDEDVWTGPGRFGWDYNRSYDVMRSCGIAVHAQRVCPPYHMEAIPQLWMYSESWPDLWERMSRRVAGASSAMRYGSSPAYASHGLPRPDPSRGETWETLIKRQLAKWPPEYRAKIAHRLKVDIARHFKVTSDPIPEQEPHRHTGMSWTYLYVTASRGDLKGRHPPGQRVKL